MLCYGNWEFDPFAMVLAHTNGTYQINLSTVMDLGELEGFVSYVWDQRWASGRDVVDLCNIFEKLFAHESLNVQAILERNARRWQSENPLTPVSENRRSIML